MIATRQLVPLVLGLTFLAAAGAPTSAQPLGSVRYAEEPTDGVHVPGVALSGEHDALAVSANPGGLALLGDGEFALALDLDASHDEATAGQGFGAYYGGILGGRVLPRLGWGLAIEALRPDRGRLAPDPGAPLRTTMAFALPMGKMGGLGFSWHRFYDDGRATDGLSTWDMGVSARLGNYVSIGALVRDLGRPVIESGPIQRRYQLELGLRPLGTRALSLAVGGRVGETRGDMDGLVRLDWTFRRGLTLRASAESRALHQLENVAGSVVENDGRELEASMGLEISFGGVGAAVHGSMAWNDEREGRLAGGTVVVRASAEHIPGVMAPSDRIERVRIKGGVSEGTLTSLVLQLRAFSRDPHVRAVFMSLEDFAIGWSGAQDLRHEIGRLRAAGKRVYVHAVMLGTRGYFVASAADGVYLDPAGGLRLVGLGGTSMYFKRFFDSVGVSAEFEKIAEYKSAPESWTMTGPSEDAARMRDELLDSLYTELVQGIATSRKLAAAEVRAMIDAGPYSAGDVAADAKLIDKVATLDEAAELVIKRERIGFGAAAPHRPERWKLPGLAVIYIDGDIVDGESSVLPFIGRRLVGGDTIARSIAFARASADVDAIVLRIDTPGGSAIASEMISREVFKTRGVKPIICSMGDVAASGGYYAAAGCDVVFAQPMTITGSIGIFYGKFDFSAALGKLGIDTVTRTRGARADMESFYRGYSADERSLIRDKMGYLYDRFITAVSDGRGLTKERVDALGRGHVWTGAQARKVGLVDRLGGLGEAIAFAKARVGLGDEDRANLIVLPRSKPSLLGSLLGIPGLSSKAESVSPLESALGLPVVRQLLEGIPASLLVSEGGMFARLPFDLVWTP